MAGHAVLRGRVVAADTGQPVRRALVRLSAPALPGGPRITRTDLDGRYEFTDLPAGRYSINASKEPYVAWSYGQTQSAGPGVPVVVSADQRLDRIDIQLPRGGAITGRVTDEFGDPLANASVTAMRMQFVQGQRRLLQAGRAQSNDIGEFRLFGLPPAQYYVSASTQTVAIVTTGQEPGGARRANEEVGLAPTFYPGTVMVNSAQRLAVGVGQTLTDINISLIPARLATIAGTVVDSRGRAVRDGSIIASVRDGLSSVGSLGGFIRNDGSFVITSVPPGEYVLRAGLAEPTRPTGASADPPEVPVATVTVTGAEVSGVWLAPPATVSLTGRVVFDEPGVARTIAPSNIRVTAESVDGPGALAATPPSSPQPVRDDYGFALRVPQGRVALNVMTAPTLNGWKVKAIRAGVRDVTDEGVEVGTQDVRDIEIELTRRLQEVSGQVTAGTQVASEFVVLVFPQDRQRWTAAGARYFATTGPRDAGQYGASTLPPGEYFAIALDHADPGEWQDPERLEGLSRQATPFVLAEGEHKTLDLHLFTIR